MQTLQKAPPRGARIWRAASTSGRRPQPSPRNRRAGLEEACGSSSCGYPRPKITFSPLLLLFAAVLTNCGAVGEPRPPLLKIPEAPPQITAEQIEGQLIIRWAWPAQTTEGTPLKNLALFRLHGKRLEPGAPPPSAGEFAASNQLLAVIQGAEFEALDPEQPIEWRQTAAAWAGQTWTLAVWAEARNGKSAGFSQQATIRVVQPLPPPGPLTAQAVPEGVKLTWPTVPNANEYRIERATAGEDFQPRATAPTNEFTDDAIAWDQPYRYRLQALATANNAHATSTLSAEQSITPQDTFPPAPPQDLRAIAGPNGVSLSWQPNPEPDLSGYLVYRTTPQATQPSRLTPEPLATPTFTDAKATSGNSYTYTVAAVDHRGNESATSEPVAVQVR